MKKLSNFINESNKMDFTKKITLKLENGVVLDATFKVKDLNESFAKEQIISSILNQNIKEILSITESEDYIEDEVDNIQADDMLESFQLYVPYTSIFEYITYNIDIISKTLESDEDVVSTHTEPQYGWSNQPEVVVFEVSTNNLKETIERLIIKLEGSLQTQWVRIVEKDW